jgi:hypothetical protein
MVYIQMESSYGIETVDEFDTREEAREMIVSYRISDRTSKFYLSRRSTRDWAMSKRDQDVTPCVDAELRF